jgi:DNA polymerase III epsilon subunit-like protein
MDPARYAVIDVETTHGDPRIGRIIEIAVVLHRRRPGPLDEWSTLVDPQEMVPEVH